jgi:hypothetical protein
MNAFPPPTSSGPLPLDARARFGAAFIAFHPFVAVTGFQPAMTPHGTVVEVALSDRPVPIEERLARMTAAADREHDARRDLTEAMHQRGRAVPWRSFIDDGTFAWCGPVNRALCTQIGGLRAEFASHDDALRLEAASVRAGVFPPTEGVFQLLHDAPIAALLERLGYDVVLARNEVQDEVTERWTTAEIRESGLRRWVGIVGVRRLMSADGAVYAAVAWDDFYTVLYGPRARLEAAGIVDLFEGFWCDERTDSRWFLPDRESQFPDLAR